MDHIVLDQSGKLVSNVFFELRVPDDDLPPRAYSKDHWIMAVDAPRQNQSGRKHDVSWAGIVISATVGGEEFGHNCPADRAHITERYWRKLFGQLKPELPIWDFVAVHNEVGPFMIVISNALRIRLQDSRLIGCGFDPVTLQSKGADATTPKLFVLQFEGMNCERPFTVRGAPNACPFCGNAPLICQACGERNPLCPSCGKGAWTTRRSHKGAEDRRLIIAPPEERGTPILEGKRWDGSDFVFARSEGCGFITKRALDWLLSIHAAAFAAHPVRVNVEGMSKEQLAQLKRAQELSSLKSVKGK